METKLAHMRQIHRQTATKSANAEPIRQTKGVRQMINKIKSFFKKPKPETMPVKEIKTTLALAREMCEYMNVNSEGKYTASEMETLALEIASQIEFRSNNAMEMVMALLNSHDLRGYELAKEMVDRMDQQKI